MPTKTSKTTRKHGTVTRIRLYADEVRTLEKVESILAELGGYNSVESRQPIWNTRDSVRKIREVYTDYQSNGQQQLPLEEDETPHCPDAL